MTQHDAFHRRSAECAEKGGCGGDGFHTSPFDLILTLRRSAQRITARHIIPLLTPSAFAAPLR